MGRYMFFKYFCEKKPSFKRTVKFVQDEHSKLMCMLQHVFGHQRLLTDKRSGRTELFDLILDCKEWNVGEQENKIKHFVTTFKDVPFIFDIQDARGYTALEYAKWRVEHDKHAYMEHIMDLL